MVTQKDAHIYKFSTYQYEGHTVYSEMCKETIVCYSCIVTSKKCSLFFDLPMEKSILSLLGDPVTWKCDKCPSALYRPLYHVAGSGVYTMGATDSLGLVRYKSNS